MFRTIDESTANLEVKRFLITLDDKFRCLIEFACDSSHVVGAQMLPTIEFLYFRHSSLENDQMTKSPTRQQSLSAASHKE